MKKHEVYKMLEINLIKDNKTLIGVAVIFLQAELHF